MPSLSPRDRLLGDHFHIFEGNFKVACLFDEQSFPFEKKKVEGDDFGDICNTRKRGPSCFLIFSVRLLFNHALMKMDESGELQRIIG